MTDDRLASYNEPSVPSPLWGSIVTTRSGCRKVPTEHLQIVSSSVTQVRSHVSLRETGTCYFLAHGSL